MKPILTRIPERAYKDLIAHCAEQTIATGRRVTQRAVVEKALDEFLAKGKNEPATISC